MGIVFLLIKQNIIMLLYLIIGYLLYKGKIVTMTGSKEFGKVLLYLVMPVAIIKSYAREFSLSMLNDFFISFAVATVVLFAAIVVSRIIFGNDYEIEHFSAAFSNAGFIGIPLVQAVLGPESVFYVSSFVALLNILQWTYGVMIMYGNKKNITMKNIVFNPIVISMIIGLIFFFIPIKLPDVLLGMLDTISAMNAPLAMIVLGTYLAQIKIHDLFISGIVYKCSIVRLIVIPALTLLILSILSPEYQLLKTAILIVASAPVGSNVAIFAQLNNKDYTHAVKNVCLSTLMCIFTMPIIIGIANSIW